jgi:putative flippase GtrA
MLSFVGANSTWLARWAWWCSLRRWRRSTVVRRDTILYATAVAIEIAVLHNFVWHVHYTWRDRRDGSAGIQLVRFHLSNGLVSMVGSLLLMRVLVQDAHLPVLVANGVAIVCCGVANFGLSDAWAFEARA